MGERDHRRFSAPVVGGSSLLVIFAVLCLTVLALLSLTTVRTDDRLSQAAADNVAAYYAADAQAEEILAQLRAGAKPEGVLLERSWEDDGARTAVYAYACPISDARELAVTVAIRNEREYDILRWQAVSTGDWTPEEEITVWDGEEWNWN